LLQLYRRNHSIKTDGCRFIVGWPTEGCGRPRGESFYSTKDTAYPQHKFAALTKPTKKPYKNLHLHRYFQLQPLAQVPFNNRSTRYYPYFHCPTRRPPPNPHAMAPSAPSNHPTHPSRASNTSETSTTATQTQTNPYTSTPVLRLRATGPAPSARRRIQWAEDVVDNEGLGRKRSKGTLST